jgi:methylglutaconyl-CoA hydratase
MLVMNTITLSQTGRVATLSLNRPEVHNALNQELMGEMAATLQQLAQDDSVRVVVLAAVGGTFCAGGDLKMMREAADYTFEQNKAGGYEIFDLLGTMSEFPKPLVGRVQGHALGGGVGLLSCCDIVVAVAKAQFGLTESRLGIVPAVISPYVINKIGVSNGRQLFLTGERFSADYARQVGLVHYVEPDEEALDERIAERVGELLMASPQSQAVAKQLIRTVAYQPISAMREYTAQTIAECRASEDGREGMSSFLEKRRPRWQAEV